ncbi:MAG: phospholipid carrier-dependent glycosyltransferase [Alphaproteobacteria bacterium]|nr:phospholipid carrier-dependent glycosyltransferase [Alphaproteobacteria bacterium]
MIAPTPPHTGQSRPVTLRALAADRFAELSAAAILALLAIRIASLFINPASLYADETQYWLWSRELDWGYFSKPPMIAWLIALSTGLFGDSDPAVRLFAPLLHAVTAGFLGLTAARLYDARTGALAALMWTIMPAVWLSSTIMSTDAALMAGLSGALYAVVRLRDGGRWPCAVMLGLALAFAFLAKYAAIYFLAGAGLAVLFDAPVRRALISWRGVLALAVFAVPAGGNIAWNAANDFSTFSHTVENANWGADMFNPGEALSFVADQLAVFGPLMFLALIAAIIAAGRAWRPDWSAARTELMLAAFAAPPLLIVAFQAFLSRAHANWGAAAYAAGTILAVAFLLRGPSWRRWALYASVLLHIGVGAVLMTLGAAPRLADAAGAESAFHRVREWPATAEAMATAARDTGAAALVFDNRNDFHQMQRYGGAIPAPLYMWRRHEGAYNYADLVWPLPAGFEGEVLVVSQRPFEAPLIAGDFARFEPAGEIVIPLGPTRIRRYQLFRAEGYAPVERNAAFEARARALVEASRADR